MSMDSINSWVDEDEIKKIAGSLLSDDVEAKDWEATGFQGFAVPSDEVSVPQPENSEKARESAGRSLAEASELAKKAGILSNEDADEVTDSETVEEKKVVKPMTTSEEDRVHTAQVAAKGALGEMDDALRGPSGATGVCVVDRDGDVLHDSMGNAAWTRFVVLAAGMAEKPEGVGVFQRISGAQYLQMIPAATSRGGIVIGLLVPKPVSGEVAAKLAAEAVEIADR